MATLEQVQDILIKEHQLSREQLAPEVALSTLGIDSLGLNELMFQIEDRFGITLPDDDSTQFVTIGDVVRFLDQLVESRGAEAATAKPPAPVSDVS